MSMPLTIQFTPEQLQVVTNCVGEAVTRLLETGQPQSAIESTPLWQAERILDSTLLEWEEQS